MARRPNSVRISYRPKRSLLRSSIGVMCGFRGSRFHSFVLTSYRFCLDVQRRSDNHADYVLVQYIQNLPGLLEGDSVQQFEANLNAPERGNGVMVESSFDDDRPTLPAYAKPNPCSYDLRCRH